MTMSEKEEKEKTDFDTETFDEVFDRSFKVTKKPGEKTFGDRVSFLASRLFYVLLVVVYVLVIGGIGVFFLVGV